MREILFRGKRIDTKEFVQGGFYRGVMNEPDCEVPMQGILNKTKISETKDWGESFRFVKSFDYKAYSIKKRRKLQEANKC